MITRNSDEPHHIPVMGVEILELLNPQPHHRLLDGTLGLGGHTKFLLSHEPTLEVYGFDLDSEHLAIAKSRLEAYPNVHYYHGNFRGSVPTLRKEGLDGIDLCILDLGICSRHVDKAAKGFSFQQDGPLDMRFSKDEPRDAATILATFSVEDLAHLFRHYGEEPFAGPIARAIVAAREHTPLRTTLELAALISSVKPPIGKKHPATQVFQALRIAVNDELASLEEGLGLLLDFLRPGGTLAVLSYHSLEDRIVKQLFQSLAPRQKHNKYSTSTPTTPWELRTPKPLLPSPQECSENPRARSAKLRVIHKNFSN